MDREETSSQEGTVTRSETDASKEDEEEKEEKGEDDERQASYARHRNLLARFRARYPEAFAEYLAVSEQLQGSAHRTQFLIYVPDTRNRFLCALRQP